MNMQVNTSKDFFEQMACAMINELGEIETIQLIDDLKIAGKFEPREYPSRLERQIKEYLEYGIRNSKSIIFLK